MASENMFVKIYDLIPLTFPKLSNQSIYSKWMKVVFTVNEVFTFCFCFVMGLSVKVTDIYSFVANFCIATPMLTIILNLWSIYFFNKETVIYHEDIAHFDQISGRSLTADRSLTLFLIMSFSVVQIVSIFIVDPFKVLFVIMDYVFNSLSNCQLAALKHMISKRLKEFVKKTEPEDRLDHLKSLRDLITINQNVNDNFSLRVASGMYSGILILLVSLTAYWRTHGLHCEFDYSELHYPIATAFSHCYIVLLMILMAATSAQVSDKVNKLYCLVKAAWSSG